MMKHEWRDRLTTVFPRQGHYASDPEILATYPSADLAVDRSSDLIAYERSAFLDAAMVRGLQEEQ